MIEGNDFFYIKSIKKKTRDKLGVEGRREVELIDQCRKLIRQCLTNIKRYNRLIEKINIFIR